MMINSDTPDSLSVSVILPTYNELENILPLIRQLDVVLSERSHEIIVVDDDSPDGTWRLVEQEMLHNSDLRLIRRIGEQGLTSALNAGIDSAQGDILVWLDSDFQHPPKVIPQLLAPIDRGADVVSGSRFVHERVSDERTQNWRRTQTEVWIHGHLSRFLSILISKILNRRFSDWTSGYIAIRRKIFDHYCLDGFYGEYYISLLHYCLIQGYKIIEVPYTLNLRLLGYSKSTGYGYSRLFILGIRYLLVVLRLSFKKYLRNSQ
jgi:dolichol-phosphate mannosyltransferase